MNCRLQIHTHARTHPCNKQQALAVGLDGGAGGAGRDDRINEPKYYRQFTLSQGCCGVIN